jgi:hypothetical protein
MLPLKLRPPRPVDAENEGPPQAIAGGYGNRRTK